MDPHVSSIPMYAAIHAWTFLETLSLFSNTVDSRVSSLGHKRSNFHFRKVLSPIKILCFNEVLFQDKLYTWLDFCVALRGRNSRILLLRKK